LGSCNSGDEQAKQQGQENAEEKRRFHEQLLEAGAGKDPGLASYKVNLDPGAVSEIALRPPQTSSTQITIFQPDTIWRHRVATKFRNLGMEFGINDLKMEG
jgi:hypothetical protein